MEWISVKDRLPADGGRILVTVRNKTPIEENFNAVGVFFATYQSGKIVVFNDKEWNAVYLPEIDSDKLFSGLWRVTHWMPLPDIPEDGE